MEHEENFEQWLHEQIEELERRKAKGYYKGSSVVTNAPDLNTRTMEMEQVKKSKESNKDRSSKSGYYTFVWDEGEDATENIDDHLRQNVSRILQETDPDLDAILPNAPFTPLASHRPQVEQEPREITTHTFNYDFEDIDFDTWDLDDVPGIDANVRSREKRQDGDGESQNALAGSLTLPTLDEDARVENFARSVSMAEGQYIDDELDDTVYHLDITEIQPQMQYNRQQQGDRVLLPMTELEMTLDDSDNEADFPARSGVLDLHPGTDEFTLESDTRPIVTLDQAALNEQALKKYERLRTAMVVLGTIGIVGTFGVIIYLLVHLLLAQFA